MSDLNFFDPYIEKQRFKISKSLLLNVLLLLIIISLIGYGIFNQIKLKKLKTEINEKRALAENSRILKEVKKIKVQEEEINRLFKEVEEIKIVNDYVEDINIINKNFLNSITSKMSEDMFLTSFNISNKYVDIVGISKDKLSIAQFKKGLESIEHMEDIFISDITKEEDFYIFDINISLEEVDWDGDGEDSEQIQEED